MTGEEIKDKAVYFDSMFPNFFQNGWIVLKEHNEKEKNYAMTMNYIAHMKMH